ncbi:hypothetical protein [Prevotella nigrescens]|nr:hypothetical protein [Prevotella nigrescens]WMS20822.1 hypothetical protein RDV52_01475 [Prevotella nigrescens]
MKKELGKWLMDIAKYMVTLCYYRQLLAVWIAYGFLFALYWVQH